MIMRKYRVEQDYNNRLWYFEKRVWFTWQRIADWDNDTWIFDASWDGIIKKAERWIFENDINSNWRYHK